MLNRSLRIPSVVLFVLGFFQFVSSSVHAASSNIAVGQTYSLSVTADGTAPFSYQWYHDGVAMSGATGSVYSGTVKAADAGAYYTTVSNAAGSATSDVVTLTIVSLPVFTTQPVGQTVTAGSSVMFTAAASGTPSPTYQWRKNNVTISGATAASYSISLTTTADAGSYTVVATNAAGSVTSSAAILTVNALNTAPTVTAISDQATSQGSVVGPLSFTIGDGQTAAGSLTVTGNSSNIALIPAGNIVFGGSGANRTVTLTPVAGQTGAAKVTVYVSDGTLTASTAFTMSVNSNGTQTQTVSNAAALTIPLIGPASTYPSKVVVAGTSGTISAVSVQINGLSHSWASDVDVLLVSPTGQKIILMAKAGPGAVSGATLTFSDTATVSLPQSSALASGIFSPTSYKSPAISFTAPAPAAPYDSTFATLIGQAANGTWSLFVMDDGNGDQGSVAGGWTLTLGTTGNNAIAPTISTIASQSGTSGLTTGAIPFTVGDSDTPLSSLALTATSSNTSIVPNTNIVFSGSGANRTVAVTPVSGKTGLVNITLTVSDGSLAASSSFPLAVNDATVAPVITQQPGSQTVNVGSSVTFTTAATGTPTPAYQWKLNGATIPGATGATLNLSNVQTANAGNYTVLATNSAGSATSNVATLTVNPLTVAPVITAQPGNQTVTAGSAVTLTASASGTPTPTYQWKKDGVAISGAIGASYTIGSATSASAGTYSVVASNSAGSATSSGAVLTVNAAAKGPVITSQPASQAVKKGGTVTFTVVATGTPAPTYQWRRYGNAIEGATGAAYSISNLISSNAGIYSVVVTNSNGSVTSGNAVLTVTSTAAALPLVDFNADNKTDLIWQNVLTGELNVWFMNGTTMDDAVSLGSFDSNWKIGAVADFNADGSPDFFCQNTSTGEWCICLLSGLTVSSKVSLGVQPLNSRVCGAGDFNGDNRPDLVVQDTATGKVSIWLMSGTQPTSVVSIGTAAANWQVCGVGDFDVNGKSDLVLQNSLTGKLNLWYLTGTKITWKTGSTTLAPECQVCGTGDFNGDGRYDLLSQNVLTGECEILIMGSNNGVTSRLSLGTQPIEWVIRN